MPVARQPTVTWTVTAGTEHLSHYDTLRGSGETPEEALAQMLDKLSLIEGNAAQTIEAVAELVGVVEASVK